MRPEPIKDCVVSDHAASEIARRGLATELIRQVLEEPEQRYSIRAGRDVLQARLRLGSKVYLVRVFVDVHRAPPEVVTAYRTSKIEKYWRSEP